MCSHSHNFVMIRKILVVLMASLALASGIVCTEGYCSLVLCQYISPETCKEQGQEYRPNSSACGCCNRCVDYLKAGECCSGILTGPPAKLRGEEPRLEKHCEPGLTCKQGRCR